MLIQKRTKNIHKFTESVSDTLERHPFHRMTHDVMNDTFDEALYFVAHWNAVAGQQAACARTRPYICIWQILHCHMLCPWIEQLSLAHLIIQGALGSTEPFLLAKPFAFIFTIGLMWLYMSYYSWFKYTALWKTHKA